MKSAFKYLLLALTAFQVSAALALSDEELGQKCLEVGKAKIEAQAQVGGCEVDLEAVVVDQVDNRLWNPYKYIWYKAPVACNGMSDLTEMVQYDGFSASCL